MNIFLYSPKHIENLAAIARTLEVLGIQELYLYDYFKIFSEPLGKKNQRTLNKISSGAFKYLKFHSVEDPIEYVKNYSGRKLATVLHHESTSLYHFQFEQDDLLMMGNETNGLPEEIIQLSDQKIKIDQNGKTESLNLGISLAIFLYEFRRQTHSVAAR